MKDDVIEAAIEYIGILFGSNSGGHDAAHSMRVYNNAMLIAAKEGGADLRVTALAALLHDADDRKLFDTENDGNARAFLTAHAVGNDEIERICAAIDSVSFSRNRGRSPETPEGRIVQDADRLDAIGAVGIARTFAYGGEHGRSLEASIGHFYDKLLLLKDELNTETAKELAEERHAFMEEVLRRFAEETGRTDIG